MAENARGNWRNWCEFFLSSLGYMVGLGNIWRFPYLCYKNGGGAFLIPYLTFLFICGVPLLCLEFCCCQFSNLGPGKVWLMCPLFKGIGIGMILVNAIDNIYYTVIISWAIYYLGMSFSPILPWSHCENSWNTPDCYVRGIAQDSLNTTTSSLVNSTITQGYTTAMAVITTNSNMASSVTDNATLSNVSTRRTSSEEFWDHHVLERSGGIDEMGVIRWQLLLCLLAAWVTSFLCLIKGIKTSGKVMYIAATAPYIILLILLIRGLFLPGALNGITYFLVPQWEMLLERSVWAEASIQVFYSIGLGAATVGTIASYNKFHNNIVRDTFLLGIMDGFTSVFAGLVIFVNLGFMAEQANLKIEDVVSEGPGIAFMVYPEALAQLPLPQLWSVCFFVLLVTVGLNSQIVHIQTISAGIMDNVPRLANKNIPVNLMVSIPSFALGLFCITQGGVYVLQLMDWYTASISMMLFSLLQVVVLAYVYGAERLYEDMELMLGKRPSVYWKIGWLVICPIALSCLWIMNLINIENVYYGDYTYPPWSIGIGWLVAISSIIPVPAFMLYSLFCQRGNLLQRIRQSIRPASNWGPAVKELQAVYRRKHPGESLQMTDGVSDSYTMKPML